MGLLMYIPFPVSHQREAWIGRRPENYREVVINMTFGFQKEAVPSGQRAQAVNMCLIIGPVAESLIYSVPDDTILWDYEETQTVLIASVAAKMIANEGYMSNGGGIKKR